MNTTHEKVDGHFLLLSASLFLNRQQAACSVGVWRVVVCRLEIRVREQLLLHNLLDDDDCLHENMANVGVDGHQAEPLQLSTNNVVQQ